MPSSDRKLHNWCPMTDDPIGLRCANMACDRFGDNITDDGRQMTMDDISLTPEQLAQYQASKARSGEQGQQ